MGQKINPIGFRLETVKNSPQWQSSWYAGTKKYAVYLLEDKVYIEHTIEEGCDFN